MSMTIGFVVRYDRAPAAPVQPPVAAANGVPSVWSASKASIPVQPVAQASWQPSADRFPAYASTTYGSRGEPNRPYLPSQSRLDLYA